MTKRKSVVYLHEVARECRDLSKFLRNTCTELPDLINKDADPAADLLAILGLEAEIVALTRRFFAVSGLSYNQGAVV